MKEEVQEEEEEEEEEKEEEAEEEEEEAHNYRVEDNLTRMDVSENDMTQERIGENNQNLENINNEMNNNLNNHNRVQPLVADTAFIFPCRDSEGKTKLLKRRRCQVWIKDFEKTLLSQWSDNPKEMVRRLLALLIGDNNLIRLCARGRQTKNNAGRPGIPEDILNDIQGKCLFILQERN